MCSATGWSRRRYVEKAGTVQYGPHGRANRRRHLAAAPTCPATAKAPVLLQVPGGAWAIGMRRPQAYPLLSHLADRGWVCVSIDYRVSPRNTWPDHIVDVKRALAWVKENIADYGGDPDFVAISGGSAGGHLAALAALTAERPAVPARVRGRRHLGGGRGADLRPLRLGLRTRQRAHGVHRVPAEVRRQEADSRRTGRSTWTRRRSPVAPRRAAVLHAARRGRFDHPGPRGPRVRRRRCARFRRHRWCMPRSRTPSTLSTSIGSPRAHYTAQAVERIPVLGAGHAPGPPAAPKSEPATGP